MAVIKVGSRGALYVTKDKQELVPTVQVSEVKDPVGAGDGFCAGFLSGLLDGLSVRESVARGNLVGSIVVQVDGDVEGLPDREELGLYTSAAEDIRR